MALRIACDLDGTLANMHAALLREAEGLFSRPCETLSELTDTQRRRLWSHVGELENFWLTLDEVEPGAVAELAALTARHGWEVLFLTRRPSSAGETTQVQSQRWLAARGFELPSVFVMNGTRGKVAAALALDAVLDDRLENCLDVAADSSARAVLVWRGDPSAAPPGAAGLGIHTVFSIKQALEFLTQLTTQAEKPAGFVGRFRAAIGI